VRASEGSLLSRYRYPAAAAAVVTMTSHVPLIPSHLEEAPYVGVLFILLCAASLAEAVLLVRHDRPIVWLLTGMTGSAAVVAYLWSRTVGLPELADDIANWTEPLSYVALAAEGLLIGLAITALRRGRSVVATGPRWLAVGVGVLLIGVASSAVAAAGGSEGHAMPGMGQNAYWQDVAGSATKSHGHTRGYYISADEVEWDYAPLHLNGITGKAFGEGENVFVQQIPGSRIGSKYKKCLYHAYTDATFTHPIPRPAAEAYLGILGPVIHAEVGDTIKIQFRNTCSFPTSMHPHGVFYDKSSEGAPYADKTSDKDRQDDAVPTGGQHTYVWGVPERSGPGPHDGSSVMWMYHGHTDEIGDTYAGLMGPMVVTAPGMARADGTPKDVDREFFELFAVMNENASPYLAGNAADYADLLNLDQNDEGFEESNLMHSINGYVYGNQPVVKMHRGDRVRWYVMSMGTEVDLHTPHWHGNTALVGGMRMDVVNLLPASMVVADMVPDNPGVWLFHCHVNDHIAAGMMTKFEVSR
jgi:hypothetical protein